MKPTLKVYLKSVLLKETGEKFNLKGKHMLSVALSLPRPGTGSIEKFVKLPLSGSNLAKLQSDQWYDTSNANPEEKVLLWEEFEPTEETGLKATISIVKEKSDEVEILKKVAASVGASVLGLVTGGPGVAIAIAAGKTLLEAAFVEQKKDKITLLAKSASWYNENLPSSGELVFHLVTEREFKYSAGIKIIDGVEVEEIRKYPKGYGIATVVLAVERHPRVEPKPNPTDAIA